MKTIPQTTSQPIIVDLLDLRGEIHILNIINLDEIYNPIYRLRLNPQSILILSSFELINEVCDNTRFDKFLNPKMTQALIINKNNLFTT